MEIPLSLQTQESRMKHTSKNNVRNHYVYSELALINFSPALSVQSLYFNVKQIDR